MRCPKGDTAVWSLDMRVNDGVSLQYIKANIEYMGNQRLSTLKEYKVNNLVYNAEGEEEYLYLPMAPPPKKCAFRLSEPQSGHKKIVVILKKLLKLRRFSCMIGKVLIEKPFRGRSSVGRALHWQCRGHGFESHRLHLKSTVNKRVCSTFYFWQNLDFADILPTSLTLPMLYNDINRCAIIDCIGISTIKRVHLPSQALSLILWEILHFVCYFLNTNINS